MTSSRRTFLGQSAGAVCAAAMHPFSCRGARNSRSAAPTSGGDPTVGLPGPAYLALARSGQLKDRGEALWEKLRSCSLCPRQCGADRIAGETGVCSSTARLKLFSAAPHMGEERPLVGDLGSGTVFFSNCNLLCCFCQNWEINHRGDGRFVQHRELAETMLGLQRRGCHNINVVTPTHVVPHIVKALEMAAAMGLHLPLVYNTGGYDSLDALKLLEGIVDIYLPDFKYQDGAMAEKYSSGAADYPEVAAAGIKEMHRQVGELAVDERGIARRGLLIRHLVMPNNIAGTNRFVRWVATELSPGTAVNIMAQYRPEHRARDYPDIARRLTREEWEQALKWARDAGLTNLH